MRHGHNNLPKNKISISILHVTYFSFSSTSQYTCVMTFMLFLNVLTKCHTLSPLAHELQANLKTLCDTYKTLQDFHLVSVLVVGFTRLKKNKTGSSFYCLERKTKEN